MGFPINVFTRFISTAPLADPPGTSDTVPLIQGGRTKKLPVSMFPGLMPLIISPVTIINANAYNALSTDYFIFVDRSPAAASTTINLPAGPGAGRTFYIADIAGNVSGATPITVTNGTIDGQASVIIAGAYGWVGVESTGVGNNWKIISASPPGTTILTTNAGYNIPVASGFIGVNLGAPAAIVLTLPAAPPAGIVVTIKDIAGNCAGATPITITGGTIDGGAGYILPFAYAAITLRSTGNGNNWAIISRLVG